MAEKSKIDISDRNYYQTVVVGGKVIKKGNSRSEKRLTMIPWAKWFPGRTVLDIGSNNGMLSLKAAESGAKSVLGIDLNTGILLSRKAVEVVGYDNIEFYRLDLNRPDFYNHITQDFDIIFFCAMLNHIKDKPRMLEWIDTHCRERLIFETNLHKPPDKVLDFCKKHMAFSKFYPLGKSGDKDPNDYHLFHAVRNKHEMRAPENQIPVTFVPKESIRLGLATVDAAKVRGEKTYKGIRRRVDALKANILANGIREPIWVVKRGPNAYRIKQGGHRLLALKEMDEYYDVPVRVIA